MPFHSYYMLVILINVTITQKIHHPYFNRHVLSMIRIVPQTARPVSVYMTCLDDQPSGVLVRWHCYLQVPVILMDVGLVVTPATITLSSHDFVTKPDCDGFKLLKHDNRVRHFTDIIPYLCNIVCVTSKWNAANTRTVQMALHQLISYLSTARVTFSFDICRTQAVTQWQYVTTIL